MSVVKKHPALAIALMLLLTLLVFSGDVYFQGGVVSGFYIFIILLSHQIDDDWLVVGITLISMFLSFMTYFIIYDGMQPLPLINRFLALAMIGTISFMTAKRRDSESKLRRANETLELRVLARTAAAEAKAKRLEQQIKLLQAIRKNNTDVSFHALDEVIHTLRDISRIEEDYASGR